MRSSLPEPLPHGPFLVHDAIDLGLSRARLRGRDLGHPLWGVRQPDNRTPTFAETLRAAAILIDDDEAFCRETSARIQRLPLPQEWGHREPIHVCGPTIGSRLRRQGIVSHRGLELRSTLESGPYLCTDAVTTWADLAPSLALDDLVVLGDAVAHWRRGIPLAALHDITAARARQRGVHRMRQALPLIRIRSDSPMETRTRLLFVRAGLPEPALNVPVADEAGEWLGTGDFVWKEHRVVAEFDGDYHRVDRRRWQVDVGRRESIQDHGWHYVQLTSASVTHPVRVARTLTRLARLLGVTLPA
ncbi:MAG: hypothetical protein ABJA89_13480 [Lapillicoccus sp.]